MLRVASKGLLKRCTNRALEIASEGLLCIIRLCRLGPRSVASRGLLRDYSARALQIASKGLLCKPSEVIRRRKGVGFRREERENLGWKIIRDDEAILSVIISFTLAEG